MSVYIIDIDVCFFFLIRYYYFLSIKMIDLYF